MASPRRRPRTWWWGTLHHAAVLLLHFAVPIDVDRSGAICCSRERVAGTFLGITVGVVGVLLLPTAATLVVAPALLVLTVAWAVVQEQRLLAAASTAIVVLATSGGLAGDTVGVAGDRLLVTAAGAVVAVLTAWLLHRADRTGTRTSA